MLITIMTYLFLGIACFFEGSLICMFIAKMLYNFTDSSRMYNSARVLSNIALVSGIISMIVGLIFVIIAFIGKFIN